jgi:hypothetical protein
MIVMPYNVTVLDLDITGTNPANKIVDEPHTLAPGLQVRSIAPNLGPFFGESIIVKNSSGVTLTRGTDYQLVELHQEATLKYGKEIFSVILIINSAVSSNVTITYQALGGHYTYNDNAIINLYNTVITDNRPVNWANVLNKPDQYPPSVHSHLLEDVFGFEAVVDYLERIKRAITLGQTSIILEILQEIQNSISVTPGTYTKVTVDNQGRVTSGSNPTTLAGYGITDAYTKTETDNAISTAISNTVGTTVYTKTEVDNMLNALANIFNQKLDEIRLSLNNTYVP